MARKFNFVMCAFESLRQELDSSKRIMEKDLKSAVSYGETGDFENSMIFLYDHLLKFLKEIEDIEENSHFIGY